uniref:Uncharacterized protein n=1 Tax=Arundo donax TaxID=35708 RepID=A0A0A9AS52_ARUDO
MIMMMKHLRKSLDAFIPLLAPLHRTQCFLMRSPS